MGSYKPDCADVVDTTRIRRGDIIVLPAEPEGVNRTHFKPTTIGNYGVSVGDTRRADNYVHTIAEKITSRRAVDTVYLVVDTVEVRRRGIPGNVMDLMSNSTVAKPTGAQIRKFRAVIVPVGTDPLSEERRDFASYIAKHEKTRLLAALEKALGDLEIPYNGRRYSIDAEGSVAEDVFDELWGSTAARSGGNFTANIRLANSTPAEAVLQAAAGTWFRFVPEREDRGNEVVLTPKLARSWAKNGAAVVRVDSGFVDMAVDLAVETVMARYVAFLKARAGVLPGFVEKLKAVAKREAPLRRQVDRIDATVRKCVARYPKFIDNIKKGTRK